ncbi:E3 ubiquitin-protein ligase MYLIP-A [Taenia solium]|eukprot:TsM_000519900 transcript=TsM_000519900 gene=TsM_000519900
MHSVDRLSSRKTVTITGRVVKLNLLEDDASVKIRNYELSSKRSADCLYRSITELHCFFRCDNVRDDVLNRTNPGINLSTIFDHNNSECIAIQEITCHALKTVTKLGLATVHRIRCNPSCFVGEGKDACLHLVVSFAD